MSAREIMATIGSGARSASKWILLLLSSIVVPGAFFVGLMYIPDGPAVSEGLWRAIMATLFVMVIVGSLLIGRRLPRDDDP